MSESYLNERGEHEIGNCTLHGIIQMLHNGWKVSRIFYRGTRSLNPVFLTKGDIPLMTFWYYWEEGMDDPKFVKEYEVPHYGTGWNTVYFIKEDGPD